METTQSQMDNYLAHYGVKGMRWGVRRANPDSASSGPSRREVRKAERQENRENRRVHNANARAAREKATFKVRTEVASGKISRNDAKILKARANLAKADAKYAGDRAKAIAARKESGKNAARQMLREAALDREITQIRNSRQASMKTNAELTAEIINAVGGAIVNNMERRATS